MITRNPGAIRDERPDRVRITDSHGRLTWPAFSPTIDRAPVPPRAAPGATDPGTATGGEDSTLLRRSRLGGICVAAVVLIALIIFVIPAFVPGCLGSRVLRSGILECRVAGRGLAIGMTTFGFISCGRIGGYDVVLSKLTRAADPQGSGGGAWGARVGGHAGRQGAAAQADAYSEPTREAHQ
jgi:hypothetical protein